MPLHLVAPHTAAGRLKPLDLKAMGATPLSFRQHGVHEPGRKPRRAGRWLIEDLRRRLTEYEPAT